MKEAVIREKLLEICESMNTLNGSEARPGNDSEGVYVHEKGMDIETVVDQLRLQTKYMMFDLEASRRENRYLRQMLEMRPPQSRKDHGDDKTNW